MRSRKRGCGGAKIHRGSCIGGKKDKLNSVAEVVRHYIDTTRKAAEEELAFYGSCQSLPETIRLAANAICSGNKRHDHQRRIPSSALAKLARELLEIEQSVQDSKSFAYLFSLVKETAKNLKYIGELTIYDTAFRIGAKLKLYPEDVYLHAGTRKGAAILGIDTTRESITASSLPSAFTVLKPYEIEDVLCMYKNDLQRLVQMGRGNI